MGDLARRIARLESATKVLTDAEVSAAVVAYGDTVYADGPGALGNDSEFDGLLDLLADRRGITGNRVARWAAIRESMERLG